MLQFVPRWRISAIERTQISLSTFRADSSQELGGDGELFFEALLFEEAGVVAIAGEEFVVSA